MERLYAPYESKVMSAEAAAALVKAGMTVGFSGFTMVGYPKAVPMAIAAAGTAKDLTVLTGASVGQPLDGALVEAGLVAKRFPYQTNKSMRNAINAGTVLYADQHLSHTAAFLNRGSGPKIDVAIIECSAVTAEGLIPAAAVGNSETFVHRADKVIVELNTTLPLELNGMHDIYSPSGLEGGPVPIVDVLDRVGTPYIPCPAEKLAAIVVTDTAGDCPKFKPADADSQAIADHIVEFLKAEVAAGRQPASLSPLQSGVGSVANAVLSGLKRGGFSGLRMFTEVIQNSALELIRDGVIAGASCTSLSLSENAQRELFDNIGFYRDRVVLRPQEVSNFPGLVRRLGLIAMNTPIECDIYGNVNSTHVMGTKIMNGIGGSGDFARNAGLSIFATSSVAKGGLISCIVPMCAHVDHTEHDVQVIVTEQGVADLRWKSPRERAETIIKNCSHPDYRPMLREYYQEALALGGHTPHVLTKALSWHQRYLDTGSMKL
ncbi:MAG: succinate CoA transferase [Oscillospiraceae bacterium]|nr:succinate CoA transferase [Oscillospiraceae bacterium]